MTVKLSKSTRSGKKWMVEVEGKTIHFGASGMSDYTIHGDARRKELYLNRHRPRENWGRTGRQTAGFWSRWLLWNKKSLRSSIRDIRDRFGIVIRV